MLRFCYKPVRFADIQILLTPKSQFTGLRKEKPEYFEFEDCLLEHGGLITQNQELDLF